MELVANNILELDESELNQLSEQLKEKIFKNSETYYNKYESLRNNYEKFKIEYEQRFIELESEYNECRNKLEIESTDCQINKQKFNEIDEKCRQLSKQNQIFENEKETLLSNQLRLSTINQNLEAEKRDLIVILDKRSQEISKLNEEWKLLNRKLADCESKNCELTIKVESLENKESTISIKEKQFQTDKERLLNEIDWLNKQLNQKSTQLLEAKTDYNKNIYDLESKIENLLAENKKNKQLLETAQNTNTSRQEQIDDLTERLQETRDTFTKFKNDYENESESREKLITLYKEEITTLKAKFEEASNLTMELREMLVEAKNEYTKLADEKHYNEEITEKLILEKEELISKLEQELKNANELISIAKRKGATVLSESDIEQLSPAAAVASRLLKSGMTLTQIYSEYVNLSDTLQNERAENERLKSYINEIINEVEDKAPLLKRQKQEYEDALNTISNLTTQLEKSMINYETLKSESEDKIKKYNLIYSENLRLKQDVNDLSRQVSTLLFEVEKLRAKVFNSKKSTAASTFIEDADTTSQPSVFMMNTFNESVNETEVTSSSDFITKHMIEFRNIDELQKQNQKLIRYAREITEHRESEEKAELEIKTKEYNEKLDMAFKQMEEFKSQREKQEHMFDEICKQRDQYKHLLNQLQLKLEDKQLEDNEKLHNESTKTIEIDIQNALEKQYQKYESQKKELLENQRLLNEEIDRYRKNLNELTTKYALSESKLESTVEKCKTLNATVEKYKKECETLKERNSKFSELIVKHEQSLNNVNSELHKSKERQGELETNLRSVTIERDLHKSNQERLSVENQILQRENQSRSLILQNLETIRSSCERNERETKLIYQDKIDGLEKENTIMRKRLETDEEQRKIIQKSFETQLKELNSRLECELKEREKTRDELRKTEEGYEQVKNKLVEVEAKLRTSEQLIQMTRNSKSSTTISRLTELEEQTKDLQLKLSLSEKEIVSLKIQLEDSKAHSKQFSTIAENVEKTLRESSEAADKTKKTLEENINQLENEKSTLENELNNLKNQTKNLENLLQNEKEISENRISSLNNDINNALKELNDIKEKLGQTEIILNERTKDRDAYVAQIRILEEQISIEIATKTEYKCEIDSLNERIREQNEAYSKLEKDNLLNSKLYNETLQQIVSIENVHKEKYENLENENKELIKQINILQDELNRLSDSIQILQKDTLSTSFKVFEEKIMFEEKTDDEEIAKRRESTSNLLEINRFLREKKDQLENKYQSLSLEHEITIQRLKKLENEYEFNKEKIKLYENEIENLKVKATFSTSANADDYNLILDSNKRLKEQYDSVLIQLNETNEKLKCVEDNLNQIKSEKCAIEIEHETILGEKTGMQLEIKRWKERVDSLLRNSDIGEEWVKAQKEVTDLQEKTQLLTDMINDLRKNLTTANNEKDNLQKEYEACKDEKTKISNELENTKQERAKKEDVFKMLVTELKDTVITVQKELELKDFEWVSKLKNIKEELANVKKSIIDRIRSEKEEIKNKVKLINESEIKINELNMSNKKLNEDHQKKLHELEEKNKSLQERIDKAIKAIKTSQDKILKQQQRIEELTVQNNEYKTKMDDYQTEFNDLKAHKQGSVASSATTNVQKNTSTPIQTNTSKLIPQNTTTSITSNNNIVQPGTISSGSSPTTATQSTILNIEQTAAPPTAYIAPSRINKILPLNTRPAPMNSSFGDSSKRTAAVQPTPHENVRQTTQVENWQQSQTSGLTFNSTTVQVIETSEMINTDENARSSSQDQSQTASNIATISVLNKRTREDDQSDDMNIKKQRHTEITDLSQSVDQEGESIEQNYNEQTETETEYILIQDENDVQAEENEIENVQEEILIDESNSGDDDESPDVINIPDPNSVYEETTEDNEPQIQESNDNQTSSQDDDQNNSQSSNDLHLVVQPDDDIEEETEQDQKQPEEGGTESNDVEDDSQDDQQQGEDDNENISESQDNSSPENTEPSGEIRNTQTAAQPSTQITEIQGTTNDQTLQTGKKEPIKLIVWDVGKSPATTSSTTTTTTTTPIPVPTPLIHTQPQNTRLRRSNFVAQQQQQLLQQQQIQIQMAPRYSGNIFQIQAPTPGTLNIPGTSDLSFQRTPSQPPRMNTQQTRLIRPQMTPQQIQQQMQIPQQQQQFQLQQQQQQQQQQGIIRNQLGRGGGVQRNIRGGKGGANRGNF